MTVTPYPAVIAAIVAQVVLPAGVTPSNGPRTDDAPGDWLGVGYFPTTEGPVPTGSFEQDWATTGVQGARNEVSEVRCSAIAYTQTEAIDDAYSRALAIFEAVQTLCRGADPSLGVAGVLWTSVGKRAQWFLLYEKGQPLAVALDFIVGYKARV